MRNKFIFHTDPGHGWLEVTKAEARELGIESKITPYSYKDKRNYYLEEDCDAPLFIDAYFARFGTRPNCVDIYYKDGFPMAR